MGGYLRRATAIALLTVTAVTAGSSASVTRASTAPAAAAVNCSAAVPGPPGNGLARQIFLPAPGGRGPITVLGDSVLQGSAFGVTLPEMLASQGWGPIRFRTGLGYNAGLGGTSSFESSVANWMCWWRSQGWNPAAVAINLGANDVGYPDCNSVAGCKARIDFLLDEIGPDISIWWALSTVNSPTDQVNWNTALHQAAAERPNLVLWDWPAALAASDILMSYDNTHLASTREYEKRSALIATDISAHIGTPARKAGGDAALPGASGAASTFVPLSPPQRVLDTRQPGATKLGAGEQRAVDLSAVLPDGAVAVALNLTAADAGGTGFLTVWPCTAGRPEVSSVNFTSAGARGAHAVVPVDAAGRVCVYTPVAANVIVDVQGAFVPGGGALLLPHLERLADTRVSGRVPVVDVVAPPGATAVVLNLTAVQASASGYLTAYGCAGAVPDVSSVNFTAGEVVAGSAFVPVDVNGHVCVAASTPVDVLVDVTAVFRPEASGGLRFVPAAPQRMLDTRTATGGWHGRLAPGQQVDGAVAPAGALAVTGTLTAVEAGAQTYLTAWGCAATLPPTSNLNVTIGATAANSLTVGVSDTGRLCVSSFSSAHVLFDTTGWWVA